MKNLIVLAIVIMSLCSCEKEEIEYEYEFIHNAHTGVVVDKLLSEAYGCYYYRVEDGANGELTLKYQEQERHIGDTLHWTVVSYKE